MSFLGIPWPWSGARALPPELAFLLAEGADPARLLHAAALARASGSDGATALLHAGLMSEEAYYRALARALGAPFLDGPIPFRASLRFPDCIMTGLAPLAAGAPAAFVLAPRGPEIAEWLAGRSPPGACPPSPRRRACARRSSRRSRSASQPMRRTSSRSGGRTGPSGRGCARATPS